MKSFPQPGSLKLPVTQKPCIFFDRPHGYERENGTDSRFLTFTILNDAPKELLCTSAINVAQPDALLEWLDTNSVTQGLASVELMVYITCKIRRRAEERVIDIVDTAIVARRRHIEALCRLDQTNIDALQAAHNRNRQTLHELNAVNRHEQMLSATLVDRLFHTKFGNTNFGL